MATHYATKLLPQSSQTKLTLTVTLNLTDTVNLTLTLTLTLLNCNIYVHFVDTHKKFFFHIYKRNFLWRCTARSVGGAFFALPVC